MTVRSPGVTGRLELERAGEALTLNGASVVPGLARITRSPDDQPDGWTR